MITGFKGQLQYLASLPLANNVQHSPSIWTMQTGYKSIIGRAGTSPPSVTTWTRCLYIYIILYIYIYMVRPTGYRIFLNVSTRFFFTVTCRHFTGHNTALTGQGKPGFSEEERERRATESDETREARLRRTLERASCF